MTKGAIQFDSRRWPGPVMFGGLLALILAAVFPGIITGRETFFLRDYGVLGYPFMQFAHDSFWRGEIPFWNPLSNCGAPFLAQWGTMALYPFSLIYLLLPLPWSLGLFCLAHLWLGGVGMRALAERWSQHRLAAAVAGLAFVFNGATLACLEWPNYSVALGWMPWLVLWLEKAWHEGGRFIYLAIAAAAFQLLVGVPEVVMLTWFIIIALAAVEVAGKSVALGKVIQRLGITVIAATGLTAVQLLPFFELAARSQRGLGFATAKWAMQAWGWGNLLVPWQHSFSTFQGQFLQSGQEFLSSYYLGAGMLVLAVTAAICLRQSRVWVLAGLTLWALLMALGDNGFLYPLLRQAMPAIGLARYPIKFVLLAVFTVPLLAAFIISQLEAREEGKPPRHWRLVGALVPLTLIGMAAIVWWSAKHPLPFDQVAACQSNAQIRGVFLILFLAALWLWATARIDTLRWLGQGLLLAVMLADIFTHTTWQNPVLDSAVMTPGLVPADQAPRWGQGRIMITPKAEDLLVRSQVRKFIDDFLGKRLALWSNLNIVEGVPKLNGSSTLQVREQAEIQKLFYETNATPLPRLADFLAVTHETSSNSVVKWTRREAAMPLVAIGQAPQFLEKSNTLHAVQQADFDPRRVVYLPIEAQGVVKAQGASDARVGQVTYGYQRLVIPTESATSAMVTIAQSHYPAWQATIDGQPATLWRANYAFQAVEVPAGKHEIVLAYRDRAFFIGAGISGISLAVFLMLAGKQWKQV